MVQHVGQPRSCDRQLLHEHSANTRRIIVAQPVALWVEPFRAHHATRLLGPGAGAGPAISRMRCGIHRCLQRRSSTRPLPDEATVPERMQIGATAVGLQLVAVAATVICKAGVQWLVHVGHEVLMSQEVV